MILAFFINGNFWDLMVAFICVINVSKVREEGKRGVSNSNKWMFTDIPLNLFPFFLFLIYFLK